MRPWPRATLTTEHGAHCEARYSCESRVWIGGPIPCATGRRHARGRLPSRTTSARESGHREPAFPAEVARAGSRACAGCRESDGMRPGFRAGLGPCCGTTKRHRQTAVSQPPIGAFKRTRSVRSDSRQPDTYDLRYSLTGVCRADSGLDTGSCESRVGGCTIGATFSGRSGNLPQSSNRLDDQASGADHPIGKVFNDSSADLRHRVTRLPQVPLRERLPPAARVFGPAAAS